MDTMAHGQSQPASGLRIALAVLLATVASVLLSAQASAEAITFRGCFASGPETDGTASPELDGAVDSMTGALVGTGSWNVADASELKNASRASLEACINAAKAASQPGDEFVFYFVGHGGDRSFPDATETNEGNGSDNHIRIGNTATGAADRMTDDQLAALLSGFEESVTMSVILNSCYSHTFFDGGNDLGSVTQGDGAPVPAGDHLAFLSASSPAMPECTTEFTDKLVEGLMTTDGTFNADTNGDGVVTTEELGRFAAGYFLTGDLLCDIGEICIPTSAPQPGTHVGPIGCGPLDAVCPTVATSVPEPTAGVLIWIALAAGATVRRGRTRRHRWAG